MEFRYKATRGRPKFTLSHQHSQRQEIIITTNREFKLENFYHINRTNQSALRSSIMVLILLTFLAGKVIYNEHKERKIRKAELSEAIANALRSKQQVSPPPEITVTQDESPAYVATEQDFCPPAYQKDATPSPTLSSESLVSLETVETPSIPEKSLARFILD